MTTQTIIKLLADGLIVPVALLAAYALLVHVPNDRRYEVYARIIMVGLTTLLLAKLLGTIFQPQTMRPFELLGVPAGASFLNNPGFPSDHALFTLFLALAVWFQTNQRRIALVLIALSFMTGAGRILALVHTPLDVIGGFAVASIGALWYLQSDPNFTKLTTRKKHKQMVQ